jgi:hypothetical protein
MFPEHKLMTLIVPASRCTSLLSGTSLASLPENLSPINVHAEAAFCMYNAPPDTAAALRE